MWWFILGLIIGFFSCAFILNEKFNKLEDENNKLIKENKRLNRLV